MLRAIAHALRHDRALQVAVLVALASRVGLFAFALYFPIANERGYGVSPVLAPAYYDFAFYLESAARYVRAPGTLIAEFVRFYGDPWSVPLPSLVSGPVFPLLIALTGFSTGNYLPLGLAYLALGCAIATVWLWWLREHAFSLPVLLLFAVLPNAIWFTLIVSTDLLFAAEFAIFYLAYFHSKPSRKTAATWSIALVLMVLTRPNGFSVLLFVALDAAWSFLRERRIAPARAIAILVLLVVSALYLYPYFVGEMRKASGTLQYFGRTPAEYAAGLLPWAPRVIDLALSWLALLSAKLLYFAGLRPSYGVTAPLLVMLRALAGVLLLPGLLALLARAPLRQRALVALYCLPFLLGPSQDRYYLAIYPLLFIWGVWFFQGLYSRVRQLGRAALGGT